MERTERFYRIERLLRQKRSIASAELLAELGISIATFKRDIEFMRERLHVPIVWDRATRGYRLDTAVDGVQELPGLWFNAGEIQALLTMRRLLADLSPGLLEPHVQPLIDRVDRLIGSGSPHRSEVEKRVRVFHVARRNVDLTHFQTVASALLDRRQLRLVHCNRSTGKISTRTVSPQRLVFYRENWYLDAWCHWRDALRSFAVDALEASEPLAEPAIDVAEGQLDSLLSAGYGIFSGQDVQWAELRFSPRRARWVSREIWHPKQRSRYQDNGAYVLEIPFSDDRELIMDILKHGAEVEVLAPEALRVRVRESAAAMVRLYR